MFRALIVLLLAIAAPAHAQEAEPPAPPQNIDFAFAPPIGETLRYDIVRTMSVGDRGTSMRYVRDYRFERRDSGYRLWVELISARADAEDPAAAITEAAAAPMVNFRYAIDLAANGEPVSIPGQPEVWGRLIQGIAVIQDDLRRRDGLASEMQAAMIAMLDRFAAMDEDGQRAQLLHVADDLLAHAAHSQPIGVTPYRAAFPLPMSDPMAMAGTISAQIASDDMATVTIEARGTSGDLATRERARYRVAPSSGLTHMLERERRTSATASAAAPDRIETVSWTLQPIRAAENSAMAGGE